jgi:adenylate kinase family enzyme
MKPDLNRILVIGDAGRGKTALAEKLSIILGIPKYSTDDYYYEIKYSKPRERQEAIASISALYHHDQWIVEGTTQWLWRPGLESADLILLLSHANVLVQWWVLIKRHMGRRDEETFGELLKLMKHVFYKRYGLGYRKGKESHAQIVEPFAHKVVVLKSFEEIDDFVGGL